MTTVSTERARAKAVLVSVWTPNVDAAEHEGSLAELARLVQTLGAEVVGRVVQKRGGLAAEAVLGPGKLVELAKLTGGPGFVDKTVKRKVSKAAQKRAQEADELEEAKEILAGPEPEKPKSVANLVVVDDELKPGQIKNLEKAAGCEVLDRAGVIIEIFHRHAHTREARLQVELARLAYEAPRLREKHEFGDRDRGGATGGKGDTELELDRRRIRDRMAELRRELAAIQREEGQRRARREGQNKVALVGYTNAGKSSLMRALTSSEVYVADKLFATLGTTVRTLQPETFPRILVSDTVGFIKKLPHDLVASFRSTLDEALEASLLCFVVDASDPSFRSQLEVTRTTLAEIGAGELPSWLVLNKVDRLDAEARAALAREYPEAVQLSALDRNDVRGFAERLRAHFTQDMREVELVLPYAQGSLQQEIRASARVIAESYDERGTVFRLLAPAATVTRLQKLVR